MFTGNGGSIVLYNVTDGTVIETISFNSSAITGWGTQTITIDPSVLLPQGKNVAVKWGESVFRDEAGNPVAENTTDTLLDSTVEDPNDIPTATNLTQVKAITEDGSSIALDLIVVSDLDGWDTITAILTLSDPVAASLSVGTFGSATSVFNAATGVWAVTGSVADVNAALAAVTLTPGVNYDHSFTITTRIRDAAGTGPADGTITVSVTPVNDDPLASVPLSISVTEDTPIALTGISFSDLDAGAGNVTATFSVAAGTLSADSAAGVTVGGTASALTLTGTIAHINAFIAASGLSYAPAQDDTGIRVLTVTINDGGNSGTGGVRTDTKVVDLHIQAIDDVAIIAGDMTGSVTEDIALVTSGILTVSDVDAGEDGFLAQHDVVGAYGTFSFDHTTGAWNYVLDNGAAAVQALNQGETRQDTFTVRSVDGTQAVVTVTINGTKDANVIDGVNVDRTETVNSDGSVSQVVAIPVVGPGRSDSDGSPGYADIPLVSVGGRVMLLVQLGVGLGLTASGSAAPKSAGSSLADLIREIEARTTVGSPDHASLTGGGSGFLTGLQTDMPLIVQSLVLTQSGATSGVPLVISGSSDADAPATALVIDAVGLAAGTVIELQNVSFATILGNVRVTGGAGSQVVYGDSASQHIVLGADDDTIHGGGGNDYIGSEGGNDWLYGDDGNDTVSGGIGHDHLFGGSGNDRLIGGSGNDRLYGDSGNDRLDGGAGRDRLEGGTGNDALYGRSGNDTLVGGLGREKLFGGAGRDVFKFNSVEESRAGSQRDIIYDFKTGLDRIDLRGIDANENLRGNQAFSWSGAEGPFLYRYEAAAGFTGKAGELRYADGILMGDTDGDGRADFEIRIVGTFTYGDVIL